MTEQASFRRARPRDVADIAQLTRTEIQRGHRWTWRARRVAQTLARDDVLGVVAEHDNALAGFAIASYGTRRAHLLLLAVAPTARRLGLGTQLVEWQMRCVEVAGLDAMDLEMRAANLGARRFYEEQGFQVVGRRPRYYERREDALLMRKRMR